MIKFSLLLHSFLTWLHGCRRHSPTPAPDAEARPTNPPLPLECEQRWLSNVRKALRVIGSITSTSDAEPIQSLHEPTVWAEALADELMIRLARGSAADAIVFGLVRDLSDVTVAIEARIREHRYDLDLSDLLRQAAAARSLAHAVRVRVTDQQRDAPDLMRVLSH